MDSVVAKRSARRHRAEWSGKLELACWKPALLAAAFADGLEQLAEELPELRRQRGGNGGEFASAETAEEAGQVRQRGGELLQLHQRGFGTGIEVLRLRVTETGFGAGHDQLLDGLCRLWR